MSIDEFLSTNIACGMQVELIEEGITRTIADVNHEEYLIAVRENEFDDNSIVWKELEEVNLIHPIIVF